jgi:hypothetical protein
MNYWIGWGVITVIYVISLWLTRRTYKRQIALLLSILNVKELQIEVGREIAANYTKDTQALRKQIEELKGENNE